ncbi:hypothetical protein V496_04491 [Pseudogymnoascus sp. VKM F-4515 (FW-2607)]|nr:hypothetical protein V496_04491 [Pseudogymnoascus sp. VKM F-4515 (FW-2607)]KFY95865.1 hypothetical protein V498_03082 [Pseudogymnoascus sp. VKM F-4517 (FW-2822)]
MDNSPSKPRKTERACKPCRDLKVRCLPCPGGGNICQKCQRSGACCIFEELKQRKKRKAPDDHTTVEVLEAKLSDLAKQLEASNAQLQTLQGSSSENLSPENPSLSSYAAPFASSSSGTQIADGGSVDQDDHVIEQLLGCGILTTDTANAYILKYRQMCEYSPFVVIPEGATTESLRQDQPFLLHAILAVSSRESPDLQSTLERSLRERLLRTVMIEGEKSIDLLQAILIYLTWEHFFHIPKKRLFNQLLHVGVSMCIDMGLDIGPCEASSRKVGLQLDHHCLSEGAPDDMFFSRAARRVYIGCYYLSSASAWVWRKPNSIHYTEYMMQCAQSLSKDPEYETDTLILPLLQTQRLGDEFQDLLLPANHNYSSSSSLEQVQTHLRTFQAKIDKVLVDELSDCLPISLASHLTKVHAYEMGILSKGMVNKERLGGEDVASTSSQLDVMMACLESSRCFVETFLSFSLSEYPKLAVPQWWGLIGSVYILYVLSIGTPQLPLWDVCVARDKVRLEIYLDLLCYRMQSITGSTAETPAGRDLYSLMGPIFAHVKASYERLKKLPQTVSSTDGEPVHGTSFEGEAKPCNKRQKPGQCPALPFWTSRQNFTNPPVEAPNNPFEEFESADPNVDFFQDNGSWLEDMPNVNLGCNLSDWNFDTGS